jgi:hypothetical protein
VVTGEAHEPAALIAFTPCQLGATLSSYLLLKFAPMNDRALLTILSIIIFISKAFTFLFVGAFFGGIAYIWGDVYLGTGAGAVIGLIVGILTGWLAIAMLNAFINWLLPDYRDMKRRYRSR